MRNPRIRALLVSCALAGAALLAAVPTAAAHDCRAENPATTCGECPPHEYHDHHWSDDHHYCYSDGTGEPPTDPPPLECDVYLGPICIIIRDCAGDTLAVKVPDDVRQVIGDVSVGELCS